MNRVRLTRTDFLTSAIVIVTGFLLPIAFAVGAETSPAEPNPTLNSTQTSNEPSFFMLADEKIQSEQFFGDDVSLRFESLQASNDFSQLKSLSSSSYWQARDNLSLNANLLHQMSGRTLDNCLGSDCQQSSAFSYGVGATWTAKQWLQLSLGFRESNKLDSDELGMVNTGFQPVGMQAYNDMLNTGLDSGSEALDLALSCQLPVGFLGQVELGLAFSQSTSATNYQQSAGINQKFNSAALDFAWKRGPFSTGISSNLQSATDDSNLWTTVDLDFAWRTPWNGKISFGARNVLNASPEESQQQRPADALGRIPYLRYKQDL